MELVRMLEHLDKDFLSRIFSRFAVPQKPIREVVDTTAIPVVDLGGGREVARLNEAHQLLIAQVLHLPLFCGLGRKHLGKVTDRPRQQPPRRLYSTEEAAR